MYNDLGEYVYTHWIGALTAGLLCLSFLIFSGWLADRKFGNYKVAKLGLVLLFPGTLCCSIYSLFPDFMAEHQTVAAVKPELIIRFALPIIQIFYSHNSSLLFKKHSPIIQHLEPINYTFLHFCGWNECYKHFPVGSEAKEGFQ